MGRGHGAEARPQGAHGRCHAWPSAPTANASSPGADDNTAEGVGRDHGPGGPHPQGAHGLGQQRGVQPRRHTHRHRRATTGRRRCGTRTTGQELLTLKGHTRHVVIAWRSAPTARASSPAESDRTAKVWDARPGHELLALKGHTETWCTRVAFSPDGTRIVTRQRGRRDGEGVGRETGAGAPHPQGAHARMCHGVAFSPDGTRIVTASQDKTAKVWDADTGQELLTLKGHTGRVTAAWRSAPTARASSPAVERPGRRKVWDARPGPEVLTLKGHTGPRDSAWRSARTARASSPGVDDQTAKVWDAGDAARSSSPSRGTATA